MNGIAINTNHPIVILPSYPRGERIGKTMWTKAEDVPKADADKILDRWDQTAPDVQRMIVLQKFLDCEAIKNELDAAESRIAEYDDLIAEGTDHPDQDAIDALRGIVKELKHFREQNTALAALVEAAQSAYEFLNNTPFGNSIVTELDTALADVKRGYP